MTAALAALAVLLLVARARASDGSVAGDEPLEPWDPSYGDEWSPPVGTETSDAYGVRWRWNGRSWERVGSVGL